MFKIGKKNKKLINEIAVIKDDRIKQAINNVKRVRIYYDDHKDVISKTKGYAVRYILPVAYGLLKNGKKAVRAYQTAGSTKRGVPRWKLFLVDNIIDWQNSTRSFKKYKQALINLGLNVNGDKHMTTLYAITPFANQDVQVAQYSHEITPEPITKTDVAPTVSTQNIDNVTNNIPKTTNNTHSIDKSNNNTYSLNKNIESPSTKPISKGEISNDSEIEYNNQPENNIEPTTEPIKKSDIENNADTDVLPDNDVDLKDSDFIRKYNDLNDRMNNLYNDNI